jgi:hypothetical protein
MGRILPEDKFKCGHHQAKKVGGGWVGVFFEILFCEIFWVRKDTTDHKAHDGIQ